MKKTIFILLLLAAAANLNAQIAFQRAGIRYELPNEHWYLDHEDRIAPRLWGLFYKREGIANDVGLTIIPNMVMIIEDLVEKDMNIIEYALQHTSSSRYRHINLEVDRDIRLNIKDAILFKGTYMDPHKTEHTVYILFALSGNKGIHLIEDVPTNIFSKVENEFVDIIKSITYSFN